MKMNFTNIEDIKKELYKFLMLEDMAWKDQYINSRDGKITHVYKGLVELYNIVQTNDVEKLYNLYINDKTYKKSISEYKYENENRWKEFPKALDELSKIKTLKALEDWIYTYTKHNYFEDQKLTFKNLNEQKISAIASYGNYGYKLRNSSLANCINDFIDYTNSYSIEMKELKEIKNIIINQSNLDIVQKTKKLESNMFDFSNVKNNDLDNGLKEITNIVINGNRSDLISLLTNMYKEIVQLKTQNNDLNLTEQISWNENYKEL